MALQDRDALDLTAGRGIAVRGFPMKSGFGFADYLLYLDRKAVGAVEADIDAKLKNAQGLRHAILRHAFTGQLVPQDPNDEPASELLKRIAAEREGPRRVPISRRRRADS
jgi:hypothetical protein